MSIRRNIGALLLTQAATWLVSIILLVEAPDRLGTEGYGALSFAGAYMLFFTLIAGLGTSALLTREIARDHSLLPTYTYNAYVLKLLLVSGLSVVAIGLSLVMDHERTTVILIIIGCGGMLAVALGEVSYGALFGVERIAKPAFWSTVQVYVANLLGIFVLAIGGDVVAFGAVLILANFIPAIAGWVMIRRSMRGHGGLDLHVWRFLARAGIPLMALVFFNQIYSTIDVPILESIGGNEPVAWYSVAYRWIGIPIFIATAVHTVYYPRFSAHGKEAGPEFAQLVNRAIRLVLLVTLPASIGLAMVADGLINTFYDASYEPTVPLVQILALHIPIAAMDTILAVALIASDRMQRYIFVSIAAAILNPIACIVLIHWADRTFDNGAIGAAIVTFGTELFVMCGALVLRSPGVFDRVTVAHAVRILAAALVIVPVVLVTGAFPWPIQVVFGVIAYAIAALLFRAVRLGELRELAGERIASRTSRRRRVPESVE